MKKFIYILLIAVTFASCEKDANIDLPDSKPELVVACFVGVNEDTVALKLTWSSPIFYNSGNSLEAEDAASVIIKKGSTQYPLSWDYTSETYITTSPNFKVGDELDLEVTYSNKTVTGKCTVVRDPNYTMTFNGVDTNYYDYGYETYLNFDFKNNLDGDSKYRVSFIGYYHDSNVNQNYRYTLWVDDYGLYELGKNESKNIKIYYYEEKGYYELDSVEYYVLTCDEDYYKYHKSVLNYQGDDFFTEPSIIYNNVEGGIGIFSSYNMVKGKLVF